MEGDRIFGFLRWHRRRRREDENNENNDDDEEDDDDESSNDDENDDTEGSHDEENNEERSLNVSKSSATLITNITFDRSLPTAHNYLGNDLQDIHGRTIHDDDSVVTLPMLSLPGVVLLPGQILPLYLFEQSVVSMVKQILDRDRTFGYIAKGGYDADVPMIGTTVELMAVKEDFDNLSGLTATKVKAIGRQRFKVISTRRKLDGILMAEVKILSERTMPDVLDGATPAAYRRLCCETSSGKRQINRLSGANLTHWPSWVYRQYDSEYVMSLVRRELASWNETFSAEGMPVNVVDFSYWVARSLPFEDAMKLRLLSIDTAVQRLRCELSVMRRCTVLCCKRCNLVIANKTDVFSMSVEGPLSAYVNPGGFVHETLTVAEAKGLRLMGRPSQESSWFDGYAWTIVQCRRCASHMGWRFTVVEGRDLKPEKFWGLCRSALKPSLDTHSDINDELAWLV